MALAPGTHRLGPGNGSLVVMTYREGMASKVGHDLILDVADWSAELVIGEQSSLTLRADPRSLQVREGRNGLKPLSDKDRAEIVKNIERKILGTDEIAFASNRVTPGADGATLDIEGDLTMAGATRPVRAEVDAGEGRLRAALVLTQSAWGITPYRGLMGALKVRDDVEIVAEARL
jgi:hypothetical protein